MSAQQQNLYAEYLQVIRKKKLRFLQVGCGEETGYLLDSRNELWVFGGNRHGQLGVDFVGPEESQRVPLNLTRLEAERDLRFDRLYTAPGGS